MIGIASPMSSLGEVRGIMHLTQVSIFSMRK